MVYYMTFITLYYLISIYDSEEDTMFAKNRKVRVTGKHIICPERIFKQFLCTTVVHNKSTVSPIFFVILLIGSETLSCLAKNIIQRRQKYQLSLLFLHPDNLPLFWQLLEKRAIVEMRSNRVCPVHLHGVCIIGSTNINRYHDMRTMRIQKKILSTKNAY